MYGKPRGPPRPRAPPVKEAEELDVYIEAVGDKGDGIAKKDGFILFVKGTVQGETCRVKVTKVLQKVGFAEKIGPAQAEPAKPKARPKPIMPSQEPETSYEDTEDFGSELDEEDDDLLEPAAEDSDADESEEKSAEPSEE
jgi:predicted RNA-binding protein with TRAM domain